MRTARQAGFLQVAADLDHHQRAVLGRLGDHRIAGGKPAGNLVAPQFGRIVEGNDGRDDAKRLAHGDGQRFLAARNAVQRHRLAENALGLFGIAAKDTGGDADFAGRLADALAVLAAKQLTELLLVGLDAIGDRPEESYSAGARAAPP